MSVAPSLACAQLLDGQTVTFGEAAEQVALALGENLFRGPIRDGDGFPDLCVFCHTMDSEPPRHFVGKPYDRLAATVSVFIRMERDRYEDAEDLSRAVWKVLQCNIPPGYIECESTDSEPLFQGRDENERYLFLTRFRLVREE